MKSGRTNLVFDPAAFLASAGLGRKIIELKERETFFTQGDPTDSIFYLQKGRARLTVVSKSGKEATITLLSAGDFVGEELLRRSRGFVCPRPPPSTTALHSKLQGMRWSA